MSDQAASESMSMNRPMNTITPAIQTLARRLIAFEAARSPSDGPVVASVRTLQKLQVTLAKLAGVAGFRSLLARALALAKADVPGLDSVRVLDDGSLEGIDGVGSQPGAAQDDEAGVVVVVQMLGLLVTFIGEPLTLHLVRDVWPDAHEAAAARRGEGQS